MKIDSHVHISYHGEKEEFSKIKGDLLKNMDENEIDYSIVIPDNVPDSPCADLETVSGIIKEERRLFVLGTLSADEVNAQNIDKFERLFSEKTIRGFKSLSEKFIFGQKLIILAANYSKLAGLTQAKPPHFS